MEFKEVLRLAEDRDVDIYIDPYTRTFKGGVLEGKKVIPVLEDAVEDPLGTFTESVLSNIPALSWGKTGPFLYKRSLEEEP